MASAYDLGFAYGFGYFLGRKWLSLNPPVVLTFDADFAIPEGYQWVTKEGQHVLFNKGNKTEFRELSRQKAKSVCKSYRKAVQNAQSLAEVLRAVRSASKAMKGYVVRNINGVECPIIINRQFISEVGKQFTPTKENKKYTLEQFKTQGLAQLDAMARLPKLIKSGGVITPAKSDWNKSKDHNSPNAFYVIGAKIQRYPSGTQRIILDLAQSVTPKNAPIVAYNLTFTDKAGFETRKAKMLENAEQTNSTRTIKFFED